MPYVFRRLTEADISLALGMNQTFREEFADSGSIAGFLRDRRNWLFAAVFEDTVIGFAYGCILQRPSGKNALYIHEVGVADAYQKLGVGTALLNALKDACRAEGIPKFFLYTDQKNAAANALYQKTGGQLSVDSNGNDRAYWFIV